MLNVFINRLHQSNQKIQIMTETKKKEEAVKKVVSFIKTGLFRDGKYIAKHADIRTITRLAETFVDNKKEEPKIAIWDNPESYEKGVWQAVVKISFDGQVQDEARFGQIIDEYN